MCAKSKPRHFGIECKEATARKREKGIIKDINTVKSSQPAASHSPKRSPARDTTYKKYECSRNEINRSLVAEFGGSCKDAMCRSSPHMVKYIQYRPK